MDLVGTLTLEKHMIRLSRFELLSILLCVIFILIACQGNSTLDPSGGAPPTLESRQGPEASPTANIEELLFGPKTDFGNASVGTTWLLEEAVPVNEIPPGFNPTNYLAQDIEIAAPGSTIYILERHGIWHRVRVDEPGYGVREGWILADRIEAKQLDYAKT